MPNDLRSRLQRLRPARATLRPPAPDLPTPTSAPPTRDLPGREHRNSRGAFHLIEERYPLTHRHGQLTFAALLEQSVEVAARLARAPRLAQADLRGLAFVDTETTGLAGGAGTLAFLIGVGAFNEDGFRLRQYFLRGPQEEPAMLAACLHDLAPRAGWVTFNGKAFDMPILESRLIQNRQRSPFPQRPHLDLLFPARWLYRGRLASCSLNSLEQNVLGVPRTSDDVPGELIPDMYVHYLRTGETHDMRRVIYHNAMDILSMVTLAAHLLERFAAEPERASAARAPEEWLPLAVWHEKEGRLAEAEAAYRRALAGRLPLEQRRTGLLRYAALLKRQGRRAEAVPLWEQLASFTTDDSLPCIELAKYYEWKAGDLAQAQVWAARALSIVKAWPADWKKSEVLEAIGHRLERLRAKAEGRAAPEPDE